MMNIYMMDSRMEWWIVVWRDGYMCGVLDIYIERWIAVFSDGLLYGVPDSCME